MKTDTNSVSRSLRISTLLFFAIASGVPQVRAQAPDEPESFKPLEIAIVGDSHTVGGFGRSLATDLANTAPVMRWGVVGSQARHWLNENFTGLSLRTGYWAAPNLPGFSSRRLLWQEGLQSRPIDPASQRLMVVALGTNDAYINCKLRSLTKTLASVQALAQRAHDLSGGHCVWIGPTSYPIGRINAQCGKIRTGSTTYYNYYINSMAAAIRAGGCIYFDSRPLRMPPFSQLRSYSQCLSTRYARLLSDEVGSRIHFSTARAKIWARCASLWIKGQFPQLAPPVSSITSAAAESVLGEDLFFGQELPNLVPSQGESND